MLGATAPYPGLRPFRADELGIFFGRDKQTDDLVKKLERRHFLAVVGPSGCGKSSLVRAGLISALGSGYMASAGSRWRVAIMRPGDRPYRRLAAALMAPGVLAGRPASEPEAESWMEAALRRGPGGLLGVVEGNRLPEGENLLLLVDQFEEIFRYGEGGDRGRRAPDAGRPGGEGAVNENEDEARAFVKLLLKTVGMLPDATDAGTPSESASPTAGVSTGEAEAKKGPGARIFVVLTMRTDFLKDASKFLGLPEAIADNQFLTPRMTRAQTETAITGPARFFGGDVEPALVATLLNRYGSDPDQLPVLQHLLMRMWSIATDKASGSARSGDGGNSGDSGRITLTMDHLKAAEGKDGALAEHGNAILQELEKSNPGSGRIAQIMFRRLTERGDDQRDTRHPVPLGEIAEVAGFKRTELSAVTAVVDAFRKPEVSFLTPPPEVPLDPDTTIDLGHESLIWKWNKLADWVNEEQASADTYRRIHQYWLLFEHGDEGMIGMPFLERATQWRRDTNPSPAWASRYAPEVDFKPAMRFLTRSRVVRRLRWVAAAAIFLILVTGVAAVVTSRAGSKTVEVTRLDSFTNASNAVGDSTPPKGQLSANPRQARPTFATGETVATIDLPNTDGKSGIRVLTVGKGAAQLWDGDTGARLFTSDIEAPENEYYLTADSHFLLVRAADGKYYRRIVLGATGGAAVDPDLPAVSTTLRNLPLRHADSVTFDFVGEDTLQVRETYTLPAFIYRVSTAERLVENIDDDSDYKQAKNAFLYLPEFGTVIAPKPVEAPPKAPHPDMADWKAPRPVRHFVPAVWQIKQHRLASPRELVTDHTLRWIAAVASVGLQDNLTAPYVAVLGRSTGGAWKIYTFNRMLSPLATAALGSSFTSAFGATVAPRFSFSDSGKYILISFDRDPNRSILAYDARSLKPIPTSPPTTAPVLYLRGQAQTGIAGVDTTQEWLSWGVENGDTLALDLQKDPAAAAPVRIAGFNWPESGSLDVHKKGDLLVVQRPQAIELWSLSQGKRICPPMRQTSGLASREAGHILSARFTLEGDCVQAFTEEGMSLFYGLDGEPIAQVPYYGQPALAQFDKKRRRFHFWTADGRVLKSTLGTEILGWLGIFKPDRSQD